MSDISRLPPRSIAAIGSFNDRARLLGALHTEFGVAIPSTPGTAQAGPITIACLAPNRFLASGAADTNLPARLTTSLEGLAAITDQSEMWATWQVTGANAREHLARVVPIDLAPDVFPIGSFALTRASHLDVRLCRTGADTYEISVTRSVADDLLHAWLARAGGKQALHF